MEKLIIEIVDEDEVRKVFSDEFAKQLIEESGWWFSDGRIIVVDQKNKLVNSGIIVHEVVEYVLENLFSFNHEIAHSIADSVEEKFKEEVMKYGDID